MVEAELHDGTILEFPDGTAPDVVQRTVKKHLGIAEQPSLMSRAGSALSNFSAPAVTADTSEQTRITGLMDAERAKVTDRMQPRLDMQGSVMDQVPVSKLPATDTGAIEAQGVPMTREFMNRVRRQMDAADPGARQSMATRPDNIGRAAAEILRQQNSLDQTAAITETPTGRPSAVRALDTRKEARATALASQGLDPQFTQGVATTDAAMGADQTIGSVAPSEMDFEIQKPGAKRVWGDWESGVVGSTGATLAYTGRKTGIQALADIGDSMDRWAQGKLPANPTFADQIVNGFGSSGSFLIPGLGVAKGTEALAILSKTAAKWAGAGTMAALEAAAESDGVYKTLIQRGETEDRALAQADGVFWKNMALLGVTDKIAFFNDLKAAKTALARFGQQAAIAAPTEGTQEFGQQIISNEATDRPLTEGAGEAAAIGAIVGGASGGIHGAMQGREGAGDRLAGQLYERVAGSQFDPNQIDAAARQALDPANAQMRMASNPPRAPRAELAAVLNDDRPVEEVLAEQAQQPDAELADLKKQEETDLAYLRRDAATEAAKAADFARAKQQQADITIDQANALTRAQGFDEPAPTAMQLAMQLAMQRAAEKRNAVAGNGTRTAPVKAETTEHVAIAEQQVDTQPTEAQKDANNYKHGHLQLHGLDIAIENPAGSVRSGVGKDGKPWANTLNHTYGYIKGATAADGDKLDVFIGPNPQSQAVYVIDQIDPDTGKYDEGKVMLGFNSGPEARDAYLSNYSAGWRGIGAITPMHIDAFKAWIAKGDTHRPLAYKRTEPAAQPVQTPVPPAQPEPVAAAAPTKKQLEMKARAAANQGKANANQAAETPLPVVPQEARKNEGPPEQVAQLPVVRKQLSVEFGGQRYPIESLQDASEKWEMFRDTTGAGVSDIGNGVPIFDGTGKQVAYVSYNGKVWSGAKYDAKAEPVYVPKEQSNPEASRPNPVAESQARAVSDSRDGGVAPTQEKAAPAITRTKTGKLEIAGFSREDVAESLKGAKIRATIAVGQDGRVLVSAVGRTGNFMPMPIKQQNAIKTALMGKPALPKKKRGFTGNLRNDLSILAPGLYADVARGGDGAELPLDIGEIAGRLRDEFDYTLPEVDTGKESDALIELIQRDILNGGGTLNNVRMVQAMDEERVRQHKEGVHRLADEYGIPVKRGAMYRPLADIEADLKPAIEQEIGVAGKGMAAAYEAAIAAGIPESEADAIVDQVDGFYKNETSPDRWVLQYREQTNALQEAIDAHQERQGRDTQGEGTGDDLPQGTGSEERPALELAGQTPAEARAEIAQQEAAAAQRRAEDDRAAAEERQARIDAEVAGRQGIAADNFTLDAQVNDKAKQKKADAKRIDEQLAGQGDLLSAPQPKTITEASLGDLLRAAADKADGAAAGNANTDATLSRTRDRSEVRFSTPYVGTTGAKLVGYVWPNKKEEYIDNRGEDRIRTVSDWEQAVENLETGRQIVHQFFIQKPDGTEQQVSAETAATLLGISGGAVRANAKKLLEREISREKAKIAAIASADKIDAIAATDSPAAAVDGGVVFGYALNAPMVQRMQAKGKAWQGIDDRIERESASRETYRFMERDGKYIWTPDIVGKDSELSRRGWKTVELRAMEIWPEADGAANVAKEESAVYAVNEPDKFTGDLFNHEIPEADRENLDRERKAASGGADSQAATVTAVRGDPANPGVFTVTTNLVTVGKRKLPLNRVRTVEDAATVFAYLAKSAVEHYDALVTDRNGKPLAIIGSFKGQLTSTSVYPGVVAQELSRIDGAATLWGAHNHPSGIAKLSRADEILSNDFAKLLRGSGVGYAGLFAMSGTANGKTQYSFYTESGTTKTGATDNTLPAKHSVPIVERELIDSGVRLGDVNTPNQAKTLVAKIARDSPGILFMDAQHRAVSFVPLDPKAMGFLRTDGRLMKLFEAASKNNAGAAVIAMPDGKVTREQFLNLQGALKSMDIRVLDGVEYDSASKAPGLSMAVRGLDAGGPGNMFNSLEAPRKTMPQDETLIIQHNLSAENLLHAFKMGGIPVPSLAITSKDSGFSSFGDITLLGSKSMADPKGYAGTKVFGADIYSPRYPNISYKLDSEAIKKLNATLAEFQEGGRGIYSGEINSVRDLTDNKAFRAYMRAKTGRAADWEIASSENDAEASRMLSDAGAEERILKGYDHNGNRRYAPHTLENVVKMLKKELRGGENFNFGVGSIRAKFTPQFKSIKQIRDAKDRLMDKDGFDTVKKEIDKEFLALSEALGPYHNHGNEFGFGDIVTQMMYDAAGMGISWSLKENQFNDVPVEQQQNIADFLKKLRALPAEYFEAKILRGVDLAEFSGAVVPEGVNPKVIEALNSRGITDIRTYKKGDDGARAKAVEALADELHAAGKGTLFSLEAAQSAAIDRAIASESRDATPPEKNRGAIWLTLKLRQAQHKGEISAKAVEMVEWLVKQNPALVKYLAVAVENPKEFAAGFNQPAYHGSPYRFDRFTLDHIGSGEGSQAYGWGLYFAGKREIAEYYRNALARGYSLERDGKKFDPAWGPTSNADEHAMSMAAGRLRDALRYIDADTSKAVSAAATKAASESEHAARLYNDPVAVKREAAVVAHLRQLAKEAEAGTLKAVRGQLYEVEIPEDGEYLLWDRPLSAQPEKVREAIYNSNIAATGKDALGWRGAPEGMHEKAMARMGGEQFYRDLAQSEGGDEAASKYLNSLGIAGIKYLDGVSRNRPLREIKKEFLAELPEDADINEVVDLLGTGTFSPANESIIKALQADDWLGFDYPAQALSAALGGELSNFDASQTLKDAVAAAQDGSTYNYVIFDENAVKVLQTFYDRPTGAAGNYNPFTQVMTLFRGNASDTTAVHEILHHLERMMPAEMQAEIRKEWLRAVTSELQKAQKAGDTKRVAYFEAVLAGDQKKATELLTGKVAGGFNAVSPAPTFKAVDTESAEFKRLSRLLGSPGMSGSVEPDTYKAIVDGLKADAKSITNLLESGPFLAHGYRGLDVPSKRMMASYVLSVTHNDEVLRSVIASVPVDVMDLLTREKLSPETLFRNESVFKDVLAIDAKPSVPLAIDVSDAIGSLVVEVAQSATEVSDRLADGATENRSAFIASLRDPVLGGHDNPLSSSGFGNYNSVDVTSPNFLKWFGDSKVVDADGRPLVVGGFYINHNEPLLPKGALEKIHKAYAQGVADKKYGNETPEWIFGEHDWALTKEQYEIRGIEPWAQKYGDPTINATISHAVGVAYDAGFKGKRRPEFVVAKRLGAVPASGFSFNRRDNEAEQGVSVMGLVDPDGAEYSESTDQVSAMFMRDRGEHYVVGLEHTFRVGADGENVLMAVTDLGPVGSQIKSAISNTGAFSRADPRITQDLAIGQDYQYLTPSEYWAVRTTNTVAARFEAKSIWARSLQWLKEALEHIKGALGLKSDHPLLKALGGLIARGNGEFVSKEMLGSSEVYAAPRIIGDSGRQYTPQQEAMFKQTGREVDQVTILGKLREWASVNWRQGLFDQFQPVRAISDKGYTLLRLSKGATGAFEAFMQHGKLSLKDGAYDADTTGGVMQEVFFPLGKETTDFLYWIAGNRAERLAMEGKERLFSVQDIAAAKSLSAGTLDFDYVLSSGRTTRSRLLAYRDSLTKFNAFNKNVMDMAEQSGLIDGASRHLWEHEFYVPFYRLVDDTDGGVRGMNIKQGAVRQQAFKKLKGGKEGLNDLLANTLMNWAHLIDASAKNRGAKETLEAAARLGAAQPTQAGDKNTVWYMDGGKKVEYTIDDPELLVALNALDYSGLRGPIMDALQKPKHWLTIGVTASPFFKIRNLIRDSVQAVATSGLSYNVAGNIVNGISLTNRDRQEYVSALAGGGLIRFGTMLEGNEAARTRQLIKKGAKDEHILDNEGKIRAFYDKYFEPGISAYNEIGNRGEEINRMSLYDQMIKGGADHATASLMARDLMDFSMQGSWTSIRFLAQVVPFFNARLEGMYKLGRAAKSDPAKFGAVLGAVSLFSLALLVAYSDDDDWKKREDWDRDNYWWFKVGGVAFRIPKPFEIGAIATLSERSAELMFDKEMTGKRFRQVTTKLLTDQLSMNPTPQLVKPILDIYANKDSFSGRPIETMDMERLDKERRFTSSTSMPARGLSTATGGALSPVQIDHLVRGYFAWLGAFTVGAADLAVRAASDGPDRPSRDYWKFATGGMIAETDSASSRYVSQMYDQAKEIETAYGTWRDMNKRASQIQGPARQDALKDAQEYLKENADKITKHRQVGATKRQISALNERIRVIERSDKTASEKRVLINNIQKLKDQSARRVVVRP